MALCSKTGKIRHRTRSSAGKHLHRLIGSHPQDETLHVYRCQFCLDWHVGHGDGDDIATSHPNHQREARHG